VCVCFCGRPRQATDVLQPAGLLYHPLWTFQLWPLDVPAPTDAFRTPAAEVGTYGRGIRTGKFCLNADFHVTFRDLSHGANLRHGTHGFTSLLKEGVMRIFSVLKNPTASAGFEPANLGTRGQVKLKLKVARRGLYSTTALYIADCALAPDVVPSFISRGATTPSGAGALY
jgi:hypothetical protein